MRHIYVSVIAIALLSSCAGDKPSVNNAAQQNGTVLLSAKLEQPKETRTSIQSDGGVFWEPSEEIKVFCGSNSGKFISINTESSTDAVFCGDLAVSEGSEIWAVYPYDEDAVCSDGFITTTIPADQLAYQGTFARNTNVTIAHSTSRDLNFYNVCGGVRFSVNETGINKVVFESLNGDVVAGKVQIGIDEYGVPYVKDVIDGRLFITLTPPSGTTFVPGQWYYLSALPGALEKGYKFRLYKNDTYAKLISGKSVNIRRSIFGSMAITDLNFQSSNVLSSFPENEEELLKAKNKIEELAPLTKKILTTMEEGIPNESPDPCLVSEEFEKIEGVVSSEISSEGNVITLQTQDNMYVNVLIDDEDIVENKEIPSFEMTKSIPVRKNSNPLRRGVKKALLLSPCQSEYSFEIMDIAAIKSYMSTIGYTLDSYIDNQVSLECCTGDKFAEYGLVLFCGHGAANCSVMDGSYKLTGMRTGQKVGTLDVKSKFYKENKDKLVFAIRDGNPYLYITSKWLEATTTNPSALDGLVFFAGSCQSFKNSDLSDFFVNNRAAFLGNTKKTGVYFAGINSQKLAFALSMGLGFNKAVEFVKKENIFDRFWHSIIGNFFHDDPDILEGKCEDDIYLIDPRPNQLDGHVANGVASLSWSQCETTGDYYYELYVDDVLVGITAQKSVEIDLHSSASNWYVVADLIVDGYTVASYKSDVAPLIMVSPADYDAVDLGLSVKWAICNIGATKPEDYGGYYQWAGVENVADTGLFLDWSKCPYHSGSDYNAGWTKYVPSNIPSHWSGSGSPDNKTILDLDDDVAHIKWGGKWRIPTEAEWIELIKNCNWTWTTINGVKGYKVSGKKTGYTEQSIFLPAAGDRYDAKLSNAGTCGYYWSSSLNPSSSGFAWRFYFYSGEVDKICLARYSGESVRPVMD